MFLPSIDVTFLLLILLRIRWSNDDHNDFGLFCFPTIFFHLQNYSLFNPTENAAYIKQNLTNTNNKLYPFHQSCGKDSPAIMKGMSSSFHRRLIILYKYLFVSVVRSHLY